MKRILVWFGFFALLPFAAAQRLPELAVPENYKLSFAPDFQKDNFEGEETISVRVLKTTPEIVLNSAEIEFQEATISSGETTQQAKITLDRQKETATLAFSTPVNAGPAERDLAPEYHLHADMDKETRSQYGFRFDMYGVRVPALLISPYIRPNTVFRSNNGVPFDHTSLIATILQWRRIKRADWQLGSRVLQAPTFEGVLQGIDDKAGGKDRMRPPEHETLGIRPIVRPGKDPKKALRYGEHVYLKFIGNKWRKSHEGPAYLGGPAIWGRVVKGGWWYPVFKEKRKEAITFLIAGPDKSNAAGEVGNGVPLQFKVATGDAAGYRLAVPEYTTKRALGSKTAYLTPDEDRGTLWHTWLIGDRISGKPLHPADEVYLFTDRYWWEPDKSGSEVSVGFAGGYDPYQKLTISEGNPEYAGFRAGEWDVWMIERAADPAPALIDGSSEKPVAASGARKDDEVEPILQLAEAWQQSAQKSEELRGDLIERWTALAKPHFEQPRPTRFRM